MILSPVNDPVDQLASSVVPGKEDLDPYPGFLEPKNDVEWMQFIVNLAGENKSEDKVENKGSNHTTRKTDEQHIQEYDMWKMVMKQIRPFPHTFLGATSDASNFKDLEARMNGYVEEKKFGRAAGAAAARCRIFARAIVRELKRKANGRGAPKEKKGVKSILFTSTKEIQADPEMAMRYAVEGGPRRLEDIVKVLAVARDNAKAKDANSPATKRFILAHKKAERMYAKVKQVAEAEDEP